VGVGADGAEIEKKKRKKKKKKKKKKEKRKKKGKKQTKMMSSPSASIIGRKRTLSGPFTSSTSKKGSTPDVPPQERVSAFPNEGLTVSNRKLFCSGCLHEVFFVFLLNRYTPLEVSLFQTSGQREIVKHQGTSGK